MRVKCTTCKKPIKNTPYAYEEKDYCMPCGFLLEFPDWQIDYTLIGKPNHNDRSDYKVTVQHLPTEKVYNCDYNQGSAFRVDRNGIDIPQHIGKPDHDLCTKLQTSKPKAPCKKNILWCILTDAQCVQDYYFNEFCDELGYDNDSISALDTYNACHKTGEFFSNCRVDIDEILTNHFEDY